MTKIAYVYKQKKADAAWSSVISELGDFLTGADPRVHAFTLDNSNSKTLQESRKAIIDFGLSAGDILVFNHAICFWLLLPLLIRLKMRSVQLVFLCHEHEHILGLKYCLRHLGSIRVKEWLRHLKLWYRIPFSLADHIVCLSSYQAVVLGCLDFERISYLGIDVGRFPPCDTTNIPAAVSHQAIVMFAHDPKRFDKGHRFCQALTADPRFTWVYGRERILPYAEVYKKYHEADIIFLPSDSESYSLVLAEAMATNRCVVTNANVGIVQLLLSVLTVDELAEYGFFVCPHTVEGYAHGLERSATFIRQQTVTTHTLFNMLKLDQESAFTRLSAFLRRIGG